MSRSSIKVYEGHNRMPVHVIIKRSGRANLSEWKQEKLLEIQLVDRLKRRGQGEECWARALVGSLP